jgi:hypothetical protein
MGRMLHSFGFGIVSFGRELFDSTLLYSVVFIFLLWIMGMLGMPYLPYPV